MSRLRVVVTGVAGQLALSLAERAAFHPGLELIRVGRPDLDLARPETAEAAIVKLRPDIVINAAAYTGVDRAEDEADLARRINAEGAGAVARAAALAGAPVIQISTDYVFSGSADRPRQEQDRTAPAGVYGQSKLDGEAAVAAANARHMIIRTAWVYSPFSHNFVRTMLTLARDRDTLRVVDDQIGNPSSALELAEALLRIAPGLVDENVPDRFGLFHLAGTGDTSWAGFVQEIFRLSRAAGGPWAGVVPISSADYPTRAVRPADSRLDAGKFRGIFGFALPPWQDSLPEVVDRLLRDLGTR